MENTTIHKTFSVEILKKIYEAINNLPEQAIESAKKEITRKGYDTTGYQYQFLVNVLNEVIGPANWSFNYIILKEEKGTWKSEKSFWEITTEMEIEILGTKRKCVGGHKSEMYADALKGAITNSFKKTLGFFSIGKKAYEGTIDDDYRPIPTERKIEKSFILKDDSLSKTGSRKICIDCQKEYSPRPGTEAYSKKCLSCFKKNGKDPIIKKEIVVDPNEPPFPG